MPFDDAGEPFPRDGLDLMADVGHCCHAWGRARLVALFGSAVLALLISLVVGFAEFASQG